MLHHCLVTNQSEPSSVHPSKYIYIYINPDRDSHLPARLWHDIGATEMTQETHFARIKALWNVSKQFYHSAQPKVGAES